MRGFFSVLVIAMLATAGCMGSVEDSYGESHGAVRIISVGPGLQVHSFSAATYMLARSVILDTRPKGTELFVDHLNMVLANTNTTYTLRGGDVESRVAAAFGEEGNTESCPFLQKPPNAAGVSCRRLADMALDSAMKISSGMVANIEEGLKSKHSALRPLETRFLKERTADAMQVGLDAGKVHAMAMLREKAVCDQTPEVKETAFNFGAAQGRSLFAQASKKVLPTIPKSQCNTDLVASTVLAEAKASKEDFLKQNALCAGYKPETLAVAVDLNAAEQDRAAGIDDGMKQGHEALRARLVKDWDCNACICIQGDEGKLPRVCFLRSQMEKKGYLMEGLSIWEEILAGDTHSLYKMAAAGEPQCKTKEEEEAEAQASKCNELTEKYTKDDCGCGGPVTITQAQKDELDAACAPAGGIPFPFQIASPLVVDLDGDGIRTLGKRVPFDLSATGSKVMMSALGGGDALLVLDLDGNGRVDSGAELFGNATRCGRARCTDGLEALAQHDGNHDGVIDAKDPVYGKLRLWRDSNADGTSAEDELWTLRRASIREISLRSRLDASFVDMFGNSATRAFTFVRFDGSSGLVPDVWFNVQ